MQLFHLRIGLLVLAALWLGVPLSSQNVVGNFTCGQTASNTNPPASFTPNSTSFSYSLCPTDMGDRVVVTLTEFNDAACDPAFYRLRAVAEGTNEELLNINTSDALPVTIRPSNASGCVRLTFNSSDGTNCPPDALEYSATVSCEPNPASCQPPKLVSRSLDEPTQTSVLMRWAITSNERVFDIEVVPGGGPPTGISTLTGITATETTTDRFEYRLTGLAAGTRYDVYLRGQCDGGQVSDWLAFPRFATRRPPAANSDCASALPINVCFINEGCAFTPLDLAVAGPSTRQLSCTSIPSPGDLYYSFEAPSSAVELTAEPGQSFIIGETANYASPCCAYVAVGQFCSEASLKRSEKASRMRDLRRVSSVILLRKIRAGGSRLFIHIVGMSTGWPPPVFVVGRVRPLPLPPAYAPKNADEAHGKERSLPMGGRMKRIFKEESDHSKHGPAYRLIPL